MAFSAEDIENIKAQAYCGFPSELPGVCEVYPTMMADFLQNPAKFSQKIGLLLLEEADVKKLIEKKTGQKVKEPMHPLEYLLKSANEKDSFFLELTDSFATFIKEDILLLPKINAVLIGPMSEKRLITKENYSDFQTILKIQNRKEIPKPPPPDESPQRKRERELREYRDRVKREQQRKQNGGKEESLSTLLEISETFGISYLDKSLYAFYGLISRHQKREKWNQDIQMLCAGADSKTLKAEYWGSDSDKE